LGLRSFPSGQSQTHDDCASIHSKDRTSPRRGHEQKGRNSDDGQERRQRIPHWDGPTNKGHSQPTNAEEDPIVITQDTVSHTSGAAPVFNGDLSNIGYKQRPRHGSSTTSQVAKLELRCG
jgi:hypothetical protein